MATAYTSWSGTYTPSGSSVAKKFRGWIEYTVSTNNNTTVTYSVKSGAELNSPAQTTYTVAESATGYSARSGSVTLNFSSSETKKAAFSAKSYSFTKGHSEVSKTLKVTCKGSTGTPTAWQNTTLTKSVTVKIPAKPSYIVTYNMNGGTGSITAQTKWYGETLTLSSTKPTRSGYIFRGWATSSSGAVAYASGASYTGNAALNLYAVWHRAPSLTATVTSSAPYYTPLASYVVNISGFTTYDSTTATATLKLGTQSVSRTSNGELTISPNAVGTFTPTITLEDSLGASTTYTLSEVTVKKYLKPTVRLSADRTTTTGEVADEGTCAVVAATFTFTEEAASLVEPTVTVTDKDGASVSATLSWYSARADDGTLSGSVSWSEIPSGGTAYALVSVLGGFDLESPYEITVTPQDSVETGVATAETLIAAFYTVDFLAGGHGIAFGQPSTQEGFEVNMNSTFHRDVYISLDENADAGTVDRELYDALDALGWI